MSAQEILDALPLRYYVVDIKQKAVIQTNDPKVKPGSECCLLEIFIQNGTNQEKRKTCICKTAEQQSQFQYIIGQDEDNGRKYYKVLVKKASDNTAIATLCDVTNEWEHEKQQYISRHRLRRAEELVSFGSWEINLNNNQLYFSDGVTKITGLEGQELSPVDMLRLVLPEYREAISSEFDSLLSGNRSFNSRFRIRKSGTREIRYLHAIAEYHKEKNMVFGVVHDVTEMEHIESALSESNADLRHAQGMALLGNWIFNSATRTLQASKQVSIILGVPTIPVHPDDFDFGKIVGSLQLKKLKRACSEAIQNGNAFKKQLRLKIAGEGEKWIEVICKPDRERGSDGYVLRGTVQDITGMKKIQQELQYSNNLFHTLIQAVPDAIYMKDAAYCKIIANTGEAKRCGAKSVDEILGKTDFEIFPEDVARAFHEDDKQVMEEGKVVINREDILPGEPRRWVLTTKVPLKDKEGRITGLVGISHDITHRKIMEEEYKAARAKAEESDRLKSIFLTNMSHEIRTPLNGILGFTDLICAPDSDHTQLEFYAGIIHNCGDRLTAIVDNIIDISLIHSNQLKLNYSRFNVDEMLNDLYQLYSNLKREALTEIEFSLVRQTSSDDHKFISDRHRISQIIKNLLDNAFKFTRSGFIRFGYHFSEQNELNLFVEDSGIGIEKEKHSLVFENFRQVEEGFTRQYEGAGLGLPIVAGIVNSLGGKISFESEEGKGSAFFVTIPGHDNGNELKEEAGEVMGDNLNEENRLHIVSFEDDSISIEYIHSVAHLMDCSHVNFDDPCEGLEYIRNHHVDLVLMDIRFPGMSGIEITAKIKSEFPKLPVIMQTAYAMREDKQKAFDAGCDEFLEKPVSLNDFKNLLLRFKILES